MLLNIIRNSTRVGTIPTMLQVSKSSKIQNIVYIISIKIYFFQVKLCFSGYNKLIEIALSTYLVKV